MMTVRFSNGNAIQYNRANHLVYRDGRMVLYTAEGGEWVASISLESGAIVESRVSACRVYNALANGEQIQFLINNVRQLSYNDLGVLARLKKELANFNAHTSEVPARS